MAFMPGIDPGLENIEGQVEVLGQVADDRLARDHREEGKGNDAAVVFHEGMIFTILEN